MGASNDTLLSFLSMTGEAVELRLTGENDALVVHFWATWCPSCGEELGHLDAAAESCAGSPVRVVTVNVGEDVDDITRFADGIGLQLPILRDPRGAVWRELSGAGLPANLIWTRGARDTDVGSRSRAQWDDALGALGCGAVGRDWPGGQPRITSPQRSAN